jgi:hypothetical protein
MMNSEAEENYSSVSDILGKAIFSRAAFVVDFSRMTRIFDPAEVA